MKKSRLNVKTRLQTTKRKSNLNLILLSTTGILSISLIFYGIYYMPWHWQLFLRWLVRGPDVSSIPERLYPELNILCYSADKKGRVNGYKGSKEIAYALGNFDCERSPDGQYWIIQDTYSFAVPGEAGPGSPLAIFLVSMVGTNYSYQIQGIVPILPQ